MQSAVIRPGRVRGDDTVGPSLIPPVAAAARVEGNGQKEESMHTSNGQLRRFAGVAVAASASRR